VCTGPIQQHLFPRVIFSLADAEVPDGRKIRRPNVLSSGMLVMKYFVDSWHRRGRGPNPALDGARDVALHPGELFFLLEQRLLREWDQHIMVNLPIDNESPPFQVVRADQTDSFMMMSELNGDHARP